MTHYAPAWRQSITDDQREEIIKIIQVMIDTWTIVEHEAPGAGWIATLADMGYAVWKEQQV